MHCIVLYCIVLYCIVLYCVVLYCIVLYCIYSDLYPCTISFQINRSFDTRLDCWQWCKLLFECFLMTASSLLVLFSASLLHYFFLLFTFLLFSSLLYSTLLYSYTLPTVPLFGILSNYLLNPTQFYFFLIFISSVEVKRKLISNATTSL